MKNIEKYKDEILNSSRADLTCCVNDSILGKNCYSTCNECKKHAMQWLLSEAEEPILDEVEREYLSAVIKPFKNRVHYITQVKGVYEKNRNYIRIKVGDNDEPEFINLPWFKANKMYKGMETGKEYTLEELGL